MKKFDRIFLKSFFLVTFALFLVVMRAGELNEGAAQTWFALLPLVVILYPVIYIEEIVKRFVESVRGIKDHIEWMNISAELADEYMFYYHNTYSTAYLGSNYDVELNKFIEYLEFIYGPVHIPTIKPYFKSYYDHAKLQKLQTPSV